MFTVEELDMLETACLAAAAVARMGGNKDDADYFHNLADKCNEIREIESSPKVWELIMDKYNVSAHRAFELEACVFDYIDDGWGTEEAIEKIGSLV